MTRTMSLAGTTLELVERGHGRPLLFFPFSRDSRARASNRQFSCFFCESLQGIIRG